MAEPVFNPAKCQVPYVAPIEAIPAITDCTVPPAPQPLRDCTDQAVSLPAPRGATGAQGGQGLRGPQGIQGTQGIQGIQGPPGDAGAFFTTITLIGATWEPLTQTFTVDPNQSEGDTVLITETIPPAEWNQVERKLRPQSCTFPRWYPHPDEDETYTYDAGDTLNFLSFFKSPVLISGPGKGRIGRLSGGKLTNVDCVEIDIDIEP